MAELSDDQKKQLAAKALEFITPIADRYELDNTNGMAALYEAFQAGIIFSVQESRKVEEQIRKDFYGDGRDNSQNSTN